MSKHAFKNFLMSQSAGFCTNFASFVYRLCQPRPMSATSVPHVTMVHDRILCDNPSMMQQASPLHPLDHMQKNFAATQLQRQVDMMRSNAGAGAALNLKFEHAIMSQFHRLPGFPSSYFGLDIITGNDSRIGFEDTLNDPYMSPEQPHTHKTMEQVLKLPALERDGARNPNPVPYLDKI